MSWREREKGEKEERREGAERIGIPDHASTKEKKNPRSNVDANLYVD